MKDTGNDSPREAACFEDRICFGPYEADFRTQELWKHGVRRKLGGQPFRILQVLISRPGELVTREELQQLLWPDGTFVDLNHSLNAAIKKLREATNDSANDPKYIETLPRRGYRFIGVIEPAGHAASEPPSSVEATSVPLAPLVSEEPENTPADGRPVPAAPSFRLRLSVPGLVLGLASALIAVAVLNQIRHTAPRVYVQARAPLVRAEEGSGSPVQTVNAKQAIPDRFSAPRSAGTREPVVLREAALTGTAPTVQTIIPGESNNAGPQFSPDGKRLAFMSNRSGSWQIWVSAADGSNPMQLTYGGGAGTPRWSPDGESITYDGVSDDGTSIYVISVDKRQPARELVKGLVPSFSQDGNWIYFASGVDDNSQVWKISPASGEKKQITSNGGFSAQESRDGYVYFSKSRFPNPEICRVPVEGGREECSLPHLRPRTWACWAVVHSGILFVEDLPEGKSALSLYEPAKRELSSLVTLQVTPFWMAATADGKKAIMNDNDERQISMVDLH